MARKHDRGLGRGLSALMADIQPPSDGRSGASPRAERSIPIERIAANPDQPRRMFSEAALEELAASIAERGIIQPLILRPDPTAPDRYQIVAGERRWRAAQRARLHAVPAIVRDFDDAEVLEVAIIENIQRADLNPVEEAQGYRRLMDRFGHTQERLAKAMGKSRSHVANLLRLLRLPEPVLDLLRDGSLTAGHARALVPSADAAALARRIVDEGLSVRAAERLADPKRPGRSGKPPVVAAKDANTVEIEGELGAALGLPVSIDHDAAADGGRVTIRYGDLQALDRLVRRLTG